MTFSFPAQRAPKIRGCHRKEKGSGLVLLALAYPFKKSIIEDEPISLALYLLPIADDLPAPCLRAAASISLTPLPTRVERCALALLTTDSQKSLPDYHTLSGKMSVAVWPSAV
jgi:hypothetical protein